MRANNFIIAVLLAAVVTQATPAVAATPKIVMPRTTTPPEIDGVLDDAVWREAAVITDFKQVEPVLGAMPSEKTEIYLAYDANMIYVGIRCYDSEPAAMIAKELRQDGQMRSGDRLALSFDTFLDRRNAFVFELNMLGTKLDARVENNSKFRLEWDGIWYANAQQDEQGWTAEVAIPVKTLSFDPATDVWGFDVERLIKRHNEKIRWSNVSPGSQHGLRSRVRQRHRYFRSGSGQRTGHQTGCCKHVPLA